MLAININNSKFWVKDNISALEACIITGFVIPRFCYHEKLSVAGNCRMCLVEIANVAKPLASCALPVQENMGIFTNTPLVKKARENVFRTLLVNHPLDCPICDQGGECDLQDLTNAFSSIIVKTTVDKKTTADKNFGPIISTIMTRCIHCTRCVRFNSEIAGTDFLGTLHRGKSMKIGNYIEKYPTSEILGNTIDLCPVGAITSKPYAFKARSWELKSVEGVDLNDSLGSNLYLNYKENHLVRITPKTNKYINENWISDKARFSLDGFLSSTTLKEKYNKISLKTKNKESNYISLSSWQNFFHTFSKLLKTTSKYNKLLFVIDEDIDLESLCYLRLLEIISKRKKYLNITCVSIDRFNDHKINYKTPSIKDKIIDIEKEIVNCFIFSSQLKIECTLLNLKLRSKFVNQNQVSTFSFGLNYNPNYKINFINLSISNICFFLQGKQDFLVKKCIAAPNNLFLWGESFIQRLSLKNYTIFKDLLKLICPTSINLEVKKKSNTSALDFFNVNSVTKKQIKESDFFFFFNIEDSFLSRYILNQSKNSYWINYNNFFFLEKKKIKLTSIPVLSNYEYPSVFLNLENRPQGTLKFTSQENFVKPLNFLSYKLLCVLNASQRFYLDVYKKTYFKNNKFYIHFETFVYKKLEETRFFFEIIKKFQNFSETNIAFRLFSTNKRKNLLLKSFNYPFKKIYKDFFIMNTLTKNSLNMAKYSQMNKQLNIF